MLPLAADEIPLDGLTQLGAVGSILLVFFSFAWQVYKRERDRADECAKEVARLNQLITDRYVPALEESKNTLRDVLALLAVMRGRGQP